MGTNEIQEALATAVEEVLETMCFLGVDASGEGSIPPQAGDAWESQGEGAEQNLTSELRFEGHTSGIFRVSVPLRLAHAAGAGFLGLDEPAATDAQAAEVVCELANMFCGSVLGRLEHTTIFRLSHPELIPAPRHAHLEPLDNTRWFDTGEGVLTVSLTLQPEYAL